MLKRVHVLLLKKWHKSPKSTWTIVRVENLELKWLHRWKIEYLLGQGLSQLSRWQSYCQFSKYAPPFPSKHSSYSCCTWRCSDNSMRTRVQICRFKRLVMEYWVQSISCKQFKLKDQYMNFSVSFFPERKSEGVSKPLRASRLRHRWSEKTVYVLDLYVSLGLSMTLRILFLGKWFIAHTVIAFLEGFENWIWSRNAPPSPE